MLRSSVLVIVWMVGLLVNGAYALPNSDQLVLKFEYSNQKSLPLILHLRQSPRMVIEANHQPYNELTRNTADLPKLWRLQADSSLSPQYVEFNFTATDHPYGVAVSLVRLTTGLWVPIYYQDHSGHLDITGQFIEEQLVVTLSD